MKEHELQSTDLKALVIRFPDSNNNELHLLSPEIDFSDPLTVLIDSEIRNRQHRIRELSKPPSRVRHDGRMASISQTRARTIGREEIVKRLENELDILTGKVLRPIYILQTHGGFQTISFGEFSQAEESWWNYLLVENRHLVNQKSAAELNVLKEAYKSRFTMRFGEIEDRATAAATWGNFSDDITEWPNLHEDFKNIRSAINSIVIP